MNFVRKTLLISGLLFMFAVGSIATPIDYLQNLLVNKGEPMPVLLYVDKVDGFIDLVKKFMDVGMKIMAMRNGGMNKDDKVKIDLALYMMDEFKKLNLGDFALGILVMKDKTMKVPFALIKGDPHAILQKIKNYMVSVEKYAEKIGFVSRKNDLVLERENTKASNCWLIRDKDMNEKLIAGIEFGNGYTIVTSWYAAARLEEGFVNKKLAFFKDLPQASISVKALQELAKKVSDSDVVLVGSFDLTNQQKEKKDKVLWLSYIGVRFKKTKTKIDGLMKLVGDEKAHKEYKNIAASLDEMAKTGMITSYVYSDPVFMLVLRIPTLIFDKININNAPNAQAAMVMQILKQYFGGEIAFVVGGYPSMINIEEVAQSANPVAVPIVELAAKVKNPEQVKAQLQAFEFMLAQKVGGISPEKIDGIEYRKFAGISGQFANNGAIPGYAVVDNVLVVASNPEAITKRGIKGKFPPRLTIAFLVSVAKLIDMAKVNLELQYKSKKIDEKVYQQSVKVLDELKNVMKFVKVAGGYSEDPSEMIIKGTIKYGD